MVPHIKLARYTALFSALAVFCAGPLLPAQEAQRTPDAALKRLKESNARFAADQLARKDIGSKRRAELTQGQRPFAVILTCADSRVAPELIFDEGLGELFVLRVAGNVSNPDIIGSIEYAVAALKTPLVVVLGHSNCGAVAAAVEGKHLEGNLGKLIDRVQPGRNLPKDKGASTSWWAQSRLRSSPSRWLKRFSGCSNAWATMSCAPSRCGSWKAAPMMKLPPSWVASGLRSNANCA